MSHLSWASGQQYVFASLPINPAIVDSTWFTVELHCESGVANTGYVNGIQVWTHDPTAPGDVAIVQIGVTNNTPGPFYIDEVKVGTTRGASDLFSDDFASGDFSLWDSTSGSPSVVSDPYSGGHGNVAQVDAGDGAGFTFGNQPDVWATAICAFPAASLTAYQAGDNDASTTIVFLDGPFVPAEDVHVENIPDGDFPFIPLEGDWWP